MILNIILCVKSEMRLLAGKNADRVKRLDWQLRKAERKGKVSGTVLEEEVDKVRAILEG
ncbi:MAG TPA: hypothetical protein VHN12_04130 [Geobacteraceae bacterium]|nr:hypothetical protein [Geobacteraceae bacterium]